MFDGLFEFCQLSAGGSAGKLGENMHLKTTHPVSRRAHRKDKYVKEKYSLVHISNQLGYF